jgi:GNAT superfamily N-acetyltransferase
MEPDYNIRMAMPEDKIEIERLIRVDLKEKNEIFEQKRFDWGILRRIHDPLQRHGIFIAEKKSKEKEEPMLIGILLGEMKIDPFGDAECLIKRIFVQKEYRGSLMGEGLLSAAINHLKTIEVKMIKINLHIGSIKTKKLLEKFDFVSKSIVWELGLNDS